MEWLSWLDLLGYGFLGAGVLVMIWSLVKGSVSVTGLGLLIAGLFVELMVWFFS